MKNKVSFSLFLKKILNYFGNVVIKKETLPQIVFHYVNILSNIHERYYMGPNYKTN